MAPYGGRVIQQSSSSLYIFTSKEWLKACVTYNVPLCLIALPIQFAFSTETFILQWIVSIFHRNIINEKKKSSALLNYFYTYREWDSVSFTVHMIPILLQKLRFNIFLKNWVLQCHDVKIEFIWNVTECFSPTISFPSFCCSFICTPLPLSL